MSTRRVSAYRKVAPKAMMPAGIIRAGHSVKPSSLSDLSDRREPSGRNWGFFPAGAADQPQVRQAARVQAPISVLNSQPVAVENKPEHLIRNLHDNLAQLLTLALIQLDVAKHSTSSITQVNKCRDLVKQALQATRHTIQNLQADPEPKLGLADGLQQIVERLQRLSARSIDITLAAQLPPIPAQVVPDILQASQELLVNACKYAGDAPIHVALISHGQGIAVTVWDEGPGFDPAQQASDNRQHYGLSRLQNQLSQAGVEFNICTSPGEGVWAQMRWQFGMAASSKQRQAELI